MHPWPWPGLQPTLPGMFVEQRIEPREPLQLPLRLGDGVEAVTRDISPSGMYLEIRGDHLIGGTVFFEMDLAEAHMRFSAEGRIVRLEHRDGVTGVALRLIAPRLESTG